MPELPEVQTTVDGLNRRIIGQRITEVWSNYDSAYFKGSATIKDLQHFAVFRNDVVGAKISRVTRRAKNILIDLDSGHTILVHMKMTGHLLYGKYIFEPNRDKKDPWTPIFPATLKEPINRRVRFVISFENGMCLALSDLRRFAKVTHIPTNAMFDSSHLSNIGPEPLEPSFGFAQFEERLATRPNAPIKLALLDQTVMAGVGNIYADESLWRANIHPLSKVSALPKTERKQLFQALKKTLSHGIELGGDSMSDYRNVDGEKGKFQEQHRAYRRTGKKCDKPRCKGTIERIVVGGRGTHYCPVHQKLYPENTK